MKFHIDEVAGLGSFIEVEATGTPAQADALLAECRRWLALLPVADTDLVAASYSDLLRGCRDRPGPR